METSTSQPKTPTLIRVLGALVYGAPEPLTVRALRKILQDVAAKAADENPPGPEAALVNITDNDIREALESLLATFEQQALGIHLVEIAEGYRFFTDPECAPWLRHVLHTEKPARLSRPALETLAIIAYRQPVARSEMEAVRGVSVDHVVRNLMELQLVHIVGRSELPGKPLLYGTTQKFLEHFGLKGLRELPGIAKLARRDREAATPAPSSEPLSEPQPPIVAPDLAEPQAPTTEPSAELPESDCDESTPNAPATT